MINKIKNNKLVIFFTFLLLVTSIASYHFFNSMFSPYSNNEETQTTTEEKKEEEPENKTINFLILGVDERDEDVGRSDTIVVLSTNLATKRIGLTSIPRDSRVEVPNHGETKINHAYAYGGVLLTKQVVEKTLNIKTDNYIVFNFQSFKNIIDLLGGIDIDIEKDMYYRDDYDVDGGLLIDFKKGPQHLNGQHAMEYVRYRDEEGDIGRVRRQQTFLNALLSKVTSPEIIPKLPRLTAEILRSVKTDIAFDDFVKYISFLKPNQKYETKAIMASGNPEMIDDLSYWILDYPAIQENLKALNRFILHGDEMLVAEKEKDSSIPDKEKEKGIFKDNSLDGKNSLDWQLEKLDVITKEKESKIKQKLLEDEARERAETLARRESERAMEQYQRERAYQNQEASLSGVRIINTTGDDNKTDFAIRSLRNNDIKVGNINSKQSGKSNNRTIFIISNKDDKIKDILNNLPFKFTVISKTDSENSTLIIGEDFYK